MDISIRRRHRKIGVPRGLLRHLSFQFLKESPMSGVEIVDKIEEYTEWRPSPGSIYPLLSQLQESGFIRPYEDQDLTLKRFELTEKGHNLLNELMVNNGQFRHQNRTFRKMYWRLHMGIPESLYTSLANLLTVLEDVYTKKRDVPEVSDKLGKALDSAISKIKEIDT